MAGKMLNCWASLAALEAVEVAGSGPVPPPEQLDTLKSNLATSGTGGLAQDTDRFWRGFWRKHGTRDTTRTAQSNLVLLVLHSRRFNPF